MTQGAPVKPAPRQLSREKVSWLIVLGLAAAAAFGGAFAGCHPTGTPVAYPIETAFFAAGFTIVLSRSSRETWLLTGAVAVVMARGGCWYRLQ